MSAVTLQQKLQALPINPRDPCAKALQELVEYVCKYIDNQGFFEQAKSAILYYILADEGKTFNPPQNWYTLSPYTKAQLAADSSGDPQPKLGELNHQISQLLFDPELNQRDFEGLMNKIRPAAKAFITAAQQVPNRADVVAYHVAPKRRCPCFS